MKLEDKINPEELRAAGPKKVKVNNPLGTLIAVIIIIFCIGSVSLDAIYTKKKLNKQLDFIEMRLIQVDSKLDEIMYFLQTRPMQILNNLPSVDEPPTEETLDSLSIEVQEVRAELDTLTKNISE